MRRIHIIGLVLGLLSLTNSSIAQEQVEKAPVLLINGVINKENKAELQEYLQAVNGVFMQYGGKPVAKYKTIEKLAGENAPEMVAVVEFENAATIHKMVSGEEFLALSDKRARVFERLNLVICARP